MISTKLIMGMPITVEIVDEAFDKTLDNIFDYFRNVDETFSTYKDTSEISKIITFTIHICQKKPD